MTAVLRVWLRSARGAAWATIFVYFLLIPSIASSEMLAIPYAASTAGLSGIAANVPGGPAFEAARFTNITTHGPDAVGTQATMREVGRFLVATFKCLQRPGTIMASAGTDNTNFGIDDYVGVGLDTSGNGTSTYYFEVNARGTKYQQASESVRYNPVWAADATLASDGWTATLVIPLAALRQPSSGSFRRLRLNFIRHIASTNENLSWAYDPTMNDTTNAFPSFFDARFWPSVALSSPVTSDAPQRRAPHVDVYALGAAGNDRSIFIDPDGSEVVGQSRNSGVDYSLPIGKAFSIVGTVAPDFSGIDADQLTIAPQQYQLLLTEYRPFFVQSANYFAPAYTYGVDAPPDLVFYSPNIGPFDDGTKIEGTSGQEAYGAMNIVGSGFDDTVAGISRTAPDRTISWSLDVVSAHHDEGNLTSNPVAADDTTADFTLGFYNPHTRLTTVFDYGDECGTLSRCSLSYRSEDFASVLQSSYQAYVSYKTVGPEYAPIDGFTSLADLRGPSALLILDQNQPKWAFLKHADIRFYGDKYSDGSGATHLTDTFVNLDLVFKNGFSIIGGPSTSYERFYNGNAVGYPLYGDPTVFPFNSIFAQVGYRDGSPRPVDFSISAGNFENMYLQQYSISTHLPLFSKMQLAVEYDLNHERYSSGGFADQGLVRLALSQSLGASSSFSLGNRTIDGVGGFALPGNNFSAIYDRKFVDGSELLFSYGSASATSTLNRFLLKYVDRIKL